MYKALSMNVTSLKGKSAWLTSLLDEADIVCLQDTQLPSSRLKSLAAELRIQSGHRMIFSEPPPIKSMKMRGRNTWKPAPGGVITITSIRIANRVIFHPLLEPYRKSGRLCANWISLGAGGAKAILVNAYAYPLTDGDQLKK